MQLVLSLFPGIGLLDMAFEEEGFCVVRGPDLLWGGDVKRFHPPAGRFDGVIGGPPCKAFSSGNRGARQTGIALAENLIPEFERVVAAAGPAWFVMENVPEAPLPAVAGFAVRDEIMNNRWFGGVQSRRRRFSFGTRDGRCLDLGPEMRLEPAEKIPAVTANATVWDPEKQRSESRRTAAYLAAAIRAQGLPDDFLRDAPFTLDGKITVVGNGVPLPLGRAVARAVKRALAASEAAA